MEKGDHS